MANHPVPAGHRELSEKESDKLIADAFDAERRIKARFSKISEAWWELAEEIHNFHEAGYWSVLGYDSLDEFLAQPDLGLSRSQFFLMAKLWRDLVVVKKLPVADIKALEPTKAREITPAIMRGEVNAEDAFDDATALSQRDVRKKYRTEERAKHGQAPDDSEPLAAENEPELVQCSACGSWYAPDPDLDGEAEDITEEDE